MIPPVMNITTMASPQELSYASYLASRPGRIDVDYDRHNCAMWHADQGSSPTSAQFNPIAVASEFIDRNLEGHFASMGASKDMYSVILPTYNERQNLPVLVQMLYDVFTTE